MNDLLTELVARARALPPEDRERLVEALLDSLHEPVDVGLDAGWEAEIARRLEEHDKGLSPAIDAAEVFAKARRLAQ